MGNNIDFMGNWEVCPTASMLGNGRVVNPGSREVTGFFQAWFPGCFFFVFLNSVSDICQGGIPFYFHVPRPGVY